MYIEIERFFTMQNIKNLWHIVLLELSFFFPWKKAFEPISLTWNFNIFRELEIQIKEWSN
jgi:hypothetical protein